MRHNTTPYQAMKWTSLTEPSEDAFKRGQWIIWLYCFAGMFDQKQIEEEYIFVIISINLIDCVFW